MPTNVIAHEMIQACWFLVWYAPAVACVMLMRMACVIGVMRDEANTTCGLLTGSVVVVRVDRSRRVTVCVTVHGQIAVAGAGYSLGRSARLVVDALEHRRVV